MKRKAQKNAILILLNIVFLFYISGKVYANGGTVESHPVYVGGNITFIQTTDIFLEKEDLSIVLNPRNGEVTARYVLRNTGGAKTVDYAFPVEIYDEERGGYPYQTEWITFLDGENEIPYEKTQINENPDYHDLEALDLNGYEYDYNYNSTEYYTAKLSFAENEIKTVTVSYKTGTGYLGWGISNRSTVEYSDVKFAYDLQPAATWGNGKAGEFNLYFDYSSLLKHSTNLTLNVEGFHADSDGIFEYHETNFDFMKQQYITCIFNYPFDREKLYEYQLNSYGAVDSVYVTATLENDDKKYGPLNLFDNDSNTIWSAANNGIGESIEMQLNNWMSVGIVNGFVKSEDLYYDNARIKKLRVEVWQGDLDWVDSDIYSYEVDFDDVPYEKIDKDFIMKNVNIISNSGKLLRFTILEVYPGRKYNDICISELYFFKLDTEYSFDNETIVVSKESLFENAKKSKEKNENPVPVLPEQDNPQEVKHDESDSSDTNYAVSDQSSQPTPFINQTAEPLTADDDLENVNLRFWVIAIVGGGLLLLGLFAFRKLRTKR